MARTGGRPSQSATVSLLPAMTASVLTRTSRGLRAEAGSAFRVTEASRVAVGLPVRWGLKLVPTLARAESDVWPGEQV